MPEIIAGTYRIDNKIGSGGSGIVYAGEHLRLGKKVVLKADKRSIRTKPEKLRREVDALKNLSHTYIPQVYDYVVEGDAVYTVMDFIEGESLDRPLKRGVRFRQPDIVEWAVQLLEALVYLHSRPPHGILHSDIKPANIMITPENKVCLIDYNIALALGEEGAVRVGYSHGYASPEHYGLDYRHPAGLMSDSQNLQKTGDSKNYNGIQPNRTNVKDIVADTVKDTMAERWVSPETETMAEQGISSEIEIMAEQQMSSETETMAEQQISSEAEVMAERQASFETETMADRQIVSAAGTMAPEKENVSVSRQGISENESYGTVSKTVVLDVRSDIYSLGSTLYHLLTGRRPSRNFEEIEPITDEEASAALAGIINKAMAKNPEDRFQTAEEMLREILSLHKNDPRAKRLRRISIAAAGSIAVFLLAGSASAFVGLNQMENIQAAYVLAEQSANALEAGDVDGAVDMAMESLERTQAFLLKDYLPESQYALTEALGVYDLADGFKDYADIELPSAPLKLEISEDGLHIAAVYSGKVAIIDTEKAEIIKTLPADPSALSEAVFADNDTLIYAGDGALTAYKISEDREFWRGEAATGITVSADGSTVASVYKDADYAVVYDIETGTQKATVSFGGRRQIVTVGDNVIDLERSLFEISSDGSRLAVSFSDGAVLIFKINNPSDDLEFLGYSDYTKFEGGFFGQYLALSTTKSGESVFSVIDTVNAIKTGGFTSSNRFGVKADKTGIYITNENLAVEIHPETGEQREIAYTDKYISYFARDTEHCLTVTEDNTYSYFDANANMMSENESEYQYGMAVLSNGTAAMGSLDTPAVRLMKLESNAESQIFAYDPVYQHSEARLSADGSTVMLFRYNQFRLYSINGEIICDVEIPEPQEVYDQQYRRNGSESHLDVIYNDGLVRSYSAADGSVISEIQGEKPDETLYEEFFVEGLRIERPFHGTPEVYDTESNEKVGDLESDDYLTYVTQAGDYIITEYISANRDRYGLVLNNKLEKLAYLPDLCDVVGEELIFDCGNGSLRKCGIYSIEDLISKGEEMRMQQ